MKAVIIDIDGILFDPTPRVGGLTVRLIGPLRSQMRW